VAQADKASDTTYALRAVLDALAKTDADFLSVYSDPSMKQCRLTNERVRDGIELVRALERLPDEQREALLEGAKLDEEGDFGARPREVLVALCSLLPPQPRGALDSSTTD